MNWQLQTVLLLIQKNLIKSSMFILTQIFFLNFKYLNKIFRHIEIIGQSNNFVFTVRKDNQVPLGEIGFGAVQVNKAEFIYKNKYIIF